MKVLRGILLALACLLLTDCACRAQSFSPAWSEWETSAVERRDIAEGINGRQVSSRCPRSCL